jgi:hypothetical protein
MCFRIEEIMTDKKETVSVNGDSVASLSSELARSKIYQAAFEHLTQLGFRPGVAGVTWGLDFTLHFGLETPPEEVPLVQAPGRR